jgi:hypothetical protein
MSAVARVTIGLALICLEVPNAVWKLVTLEGLDPENGPEPVQHK